jgi:hypothetical protein
MMYEQQMGTERVPEQMDACRHRSHWNVRGNGSRGKAQITDIVGVADLDSENDINEFVKHAKNGKSGTANQRTCEGSDFISGFAAGQWPQDPRIPVHP